MEKFSTRIRPFNKRMLRLPIWIGRFQVFRPSVSARSRTSGPRSTVTVVTTDTARIAAATPRARLT